jgi:hypothetical protein
MKFHPNRSSDPSRLLLSALGIVFLGGAEIANCAVIDLFAESPQTLALDANTRHLSESVALASSSFSSRQTSLYGAGQSVAISTLANEVDYSFPISGAAVGQFSLTYTSSQSANLVKNGETGILLCFENVQLASSATITVGYYSTQWKGSTQVSLTGAEGDEEVFVPFSAFQNSKPGDFAKVTSLSVTTKNLQPGDRFSMGAITSIPEMSSPALLALAAVCVAGKRRR